MRGLGQRVEAWLPHRQSPKPATLTKGKLKRRVHDSVIFETGGRRPYRLTRDTALRRTNQSDLPTQRHEEHGILVHARVIFLHLHFGLTGKLEGTSSGVAVGTEE